jgi:multidrug transporter EmrE-like cation transporter
VLNIAVLGAVTLLLAFGQLLFKRVGLSVQGQTVHEMLLHLVASPIFYLALVIYAFATLLWIFVLSRVSLSQAYPWVAIGVALVPFLASLAFDERVGPSYWWGVALIMVGILLTQRGIVD